MLKGRADAPAAAWSPTKPGGGGGGRFCACLRAARAGCSRAVACGHARRRLPDHLHHLTLTLTKDISTPMGGTDSSSLHLPSAGRVSLRSGAADPARRWPLSLPFFCCARWWRRAAGASRGGCLSSVHGSVWPGEVRLIRWTHLLCLRAVMVITGCDPPRSLAPATVSVMSRMIGRDTGAGAGGRSGGWRPLLWTAATAVAA